VKVDTDHGLIRDLEATPANVHDSRVDLSVLGEVVYRDYGLSGCGAPWLGRDDEAGIAGSSIMYLGSAEER